MLTFARRLITARHERHTASRFKSSWALALGLFLFLCGVIPSNAQSGAGTIQGTVKDKSGAVVANARVNIRNPANGTEVNTVSNRDGFYIAPGLFAGDYDLAVSAPGQARFEKHLTLQAGQNAVIDARLSIESVSSQVTVEAGTNQLATYDAPTISSELDRARVEQLPENTRSLANLVQLTTPGVEGGRVNGNREAAFEFIQDGAALANRNSGGNTILPDPDTVQEVRIETQNSSAKFDRPATAILTTRSGTNALHGSLFETAVNSYFGIAKARENPSGFVQPHYVRNEFGASVGGPILIPKLYDGRNKSFFFFAYERYSLRRAQSLNLSVPTDAMRMGDFSSLQASGIQLPIYDPNTTNPVTFARSQFNYGGPANCVAATQMVPNPPNLCSNKIDPARISPLAKSLYAITREPNLNLGTNPQFASNLSLAAPNNSTIPNITFRLDQHFSEKNNVYLRFTDSATHSLAVVGTGSKGAPTTDGNFNLAAGAVQVFSAALGYTHVFSPSFFSETVLSQEWEKDFTPNGTAQTPQDFQAKYGLPDNFPENYTPDILGEPFQQYGQGTAYYSSQIISVLDENLTKIVGRNQLQFGGRYRHERIGIFPDQTPPNVTFGSQGTGLINPASVANKTYSQLANTGFSGADFFLGTAQSYSVNLNEGYQHYRDQEIALYFQDDYHPTARLTINAGIRWEIHPTFTEQHNQTGSFDLQNHAIVTGSPISDLIARGTTTQAAITNLQNNGVKFETAAQAGLPAGLTYPNYFNFAPRVGFAYRLFDKNNSTVVRGGFGRYIYPIPTRNFYANTRASVPFAIGYQQSYTNQLYTPDNQPNYLLRATQAQVPVAGLNSSNVVNTASTTAIQPGVTVEWLNPHFPTTNVDQANLTIEQPLKPDSFLRITYSLDHGTNLEQDQNINAAPSPYTYALRTGNAIPGGALGALSAQPYDQFAYGTLFQVNKTGYSYDNSIQVNYQRLFKKGYAYQAFYVFSSAQRIGGNAFRDSIVYPSQDFAPGTPLAGASYDAINNASNYIRDTGIPEHRFRANALVDVPIGRGKRFLKNSNRLIDELVGGIQLAGVGNLFSQSFQLAATNYGPSNGLQVYKHAYKVQDCRSGACLPYYLYFNGVFAPGVIPVSNGGTCVAKCINGLPGSKYVGYTQPYDVRPTVTNAAGQSVANPNFFTNNVVLPLANGSSLQTAYSPGPNNILNPFSKTVIQGPFRSTVDLSLFKVFPITDNSFLRINVDVFNAFNQQGATNPSASEGLEGYQPGFGNTTSGNTPRQIQLTGRLTF